jgi:hypothetical protein
MIVGMARGSDGVPVGRVVGDGGGVDVGFPKTAEEIVHDVVTTNRAITTIKTVLKRVFMITCPYFFLGFVKLLTEIAGRRRRSDKIDVRYIHSSHWSYCHTFYLR